MSSRSRTASRDPFVALSDPTRRKLLDLLTKGELPVNDLAAHFDVTRPAISQHLRVLRDSKLVRETRVGRERRYRLHAASLRTVYDWVRKYEVFWDARLHRLGQVLERSDL
jgi:DNA-binding transcriptional ArsR family regulator